MAETSQLSFADITSIIKPTAKNYSLLGVAWVVFACTLLNADVYAYSTIIRVIMRRPIAMYTQHNFHSACVAMGQKRIV